MSCKFSSGGGFDVFNHSLKKLVMIRWRLVWSIICAFVICIQLDFALRYYVESYFSILSYQIMIPVEIEVRESIMLSTMRNKGKEKTYFVNW